uniref:Uncharacterized protein n=1 Tax=Alexandrium monilatum TaxID=311494 RepID=A0A7S4UKR9_9DINO
MMISLRVGSEGQAPPKHPAPPRSSAQAPTQPKPQHGAKPLRGLHVTTGEVILLRSESERRGAGVMGDGPLLEGGQEASAARAPKPAIQVRGRMHGPVEDGPCAAVLGGWGGALQRSSSPVRATAAPPPPLPPWAGAGLQQRPLLEQSCPSRPLPPPPAGSSPQPPAVQVQCRGRPCAASASGLQLVAGRPPARSQSPGTALANPGRAPSAPR